MAINLDKTLKIKIRIAQLKVDAHYKGTCKLSSSELVKYEQFLKENKLPTL